MDTPGIGKLIEWPANRDAIHIAIAPVTAAMRLYPGDLIGWHDKKAGTVSRETTKAFGIVDPFLDKIVSQGQRFYAFLFPGTVTGMRHEWQHPDFANELPVNEQAHDKTLEKSQAEAWLRAFASKWCFNYDDMIARAKIEEGYVVAKGIDLHSASDLDPGDEDQFWRNIEILTGSTFDHDHRRNFAWSCSC